MNLRQDMYHENKNAEKTHHQRILIIEKENHHALWLCEYLVSKGYDVSIAANFGEGLTVLQTRPIDGILLNLDGGSGNALDMVAVIRTQYAQIPMFVMSEHPDRQTIGNSFSNGVKGFLAKPILYDQLQSTLFAIERQHV